MICRCHRKFDQVDAIEFADDRRFGVRDQVPTRRRPVPAEDADGDAELPEGLPRGLQAQVYSDIVMIQFFSGVGMSESTSVKNDHRIITSLATQVARRLLAGAPRPPHGRRLCGLPESRLRLHREQSGELRFLNI